VRILVIGTGMVGSAAVTALSERGHEVIGAFRSSSPAGAAGSAANGALEAFTMAAAAELPRGIRINAVSPTVLVESKEHHAAFPGFTQVTAVAVGRAYVKAVEGVQTGQVYALDGQ
jgi:nucleoside-diphosphate-sugar epimerase